MGLALFVVLILLVAGALPRSRYSRKWGYGPSGGVGLVLVIVLVLIISRVIQRRF